MKKCLMIALLVCLLGSPGGVYALTCKSSTSEERFAKSDAVFVGKITSIDSLDRGSRNPGILTNFEAFLVTFEVEKSWKGLSKQSVVIYQKYYTDDGLNPFRVSGRYLIYGKEIITDLLSAGSCHSTISIEEAEEDIKKINAITSSKNH